MDAIDAIFQRKSIQIPRLIAYGFAADGDAFVYEKILQDSGFLLSVMVSNTGKVSANVVDPSTNEPYILHLMDGAAGSFVGRVKAEYEETLTDIAEKCCEPDVFKSAMARALIAYVRDKYENELEYPWEQFPDNAVWRRDDNKKWYGLLLTVVGRKLGIGFDKAVEIIDLRAEPERLNTLLAKEGYYPGWHMNKKHWYTILLDGSVPVAEICRRIDDSYLLAEKK